MISGRMDRKITLQEPTTTTNDYGEETTTYTDQPDTFANIKQQSSLEVFNGGKISEVEAIFTIRYRIGVTATWWIIYNGDTYEIMGKPREIGRRRFLEIMARSQSS